MVTVAQSSVVNSLVVSGSGVVVNASSSLNVISGLTVSLGATFETGNAASFCGTLLLDRGFYLVGVSRLPPLVLRVSGLATVLRSSMLVRTSLPTGAGWFGTGQGQVALYYGGATTGFTGVSDVSNAFAYVQVRYAAAVAVERFASSAVLPPASAGAVASVVPIAVDQVQGWVFAVGPGLVGLILLLLLAGFFIMSRCDKSPRYVQVKEEEYTVPVPTAAKSNSTLMAAIASTRNGSDDYDYPAPDPAPPRMFTPTPAKEKQSWSESHSYDGPPSERGQGALDGGMPSDRSVMAARRESVPFFATEDVPMEEIRYATLQQPPPPLAPPPAMEPPPSVIPTRSTETFDDQELRRVPAFPVQVPKDPEPEEFFPPPPPVPEEEDPPVHEDEDPAKDEEESGFSTGEFPEPPSTMFPPPPSTVAVFTREEQVKETNKRDSWSAPPPSLSTPSDFEPEAPPPPPPMPFSPPPPPPSSVTLLPPPPPLIAPPPLEAPPVSERSANVVESTPPSSPPPVVFAPPSLSTPVSAMSTGMIPLKVEFPGLGLQSLVVPGKFTGQEALEYIQAKQGGNVSSSRMGLRADPMSFLYASEDFKAEPNYPFLSRELPIEHYGNMLRDATLHWDELQALIKVFDRKWAATKKQDF